MGRIKNLTSATDAAADDKLAIDGDTGGTRSIGVASILARQITGQSAATAIAADDVAVLHNATDGVRTVDVNLLVPLYRARVTQGGANAPQSINVFTNHVTDSSGVVLTPTWSRTSAGLYQIDFGATVSEPLNDITTGIFARSFNVQQTEFAVWAANGNGLGAGKIDVFRFNSSGTLADFSVSQSFLFEIIKAAV